MTQNDMTVLLELDILFNMNTYNMTLLVHLNLPCFMTHEKRTVLVNMDSPCYVTLIGINCNKLSSNIGIVVAVGVFITFCIIKKINVGEKIFLYTK